MILLYFGRSCKSLCLQWIGNRLNVDLLNKVYKLDIDYIIIQCIFLDLNNYQSYSVLIEVFLNKLFWFDVMFGVILIFYFKVCVDQN